MYNVMTENFEVNNLGGGKLKTKIKNAGGKVKEQVKKDVNKVKETVKKVEEKVKKTVDKAIDKAKEVGNIALLIPFKPVMLTALKARRVDVPKGASLEKIALLFHANVMSSSHFEVNHADEEVKPEGPNLAGSAVSSAISAGLAASGAPVPPAVIDAIVQQIIKFIKKIKEKKDKGEPLTPAEQAVLDEAEKVAAGEGTKSPMSKNAKIGLGAAGLIAAKLLFF